MASISKELTDKKGRRYYRIQVSRGRGETPQEKRWMVPDGWSKRTIQRELTKFAAAFEIEVKAGMVETRAEKKARETAEAREAEKIRTVEQYALEVYLPLKKATLSANSVARYQSYIDLHIIPALGHILMQDVTPGLLQKFLMEFDKTHAYNTTSGIYVVLNGIFETAFQHDAIPMNPLLKVQRPVMSKDEKAKQSSKKKSFTADELRYVLACISQEPLVWQTFIHLAADSGMRRGELCGLRWRDIDFKHGTLTVQNNLQYSKQQGLFETSPKSGKIRTIDIGPGVLVLLKRLRAEQASSCISVYVFSQKGSPEPINPYYVNRKFAILKKKYGLEAFRPHMLRHSSASLAITNGADVTSTSARLGHANTSVTLDMYTHASEESIRRAGQAVRDALEGAL